MPSKRQNLPGRRPRSNRARSRQSAPPPARPISDDEAIALADSVDGLQAAEPVAVAAPVAPAPRLSAAERAAQRRAARAQRPASSARRRVSHDFGYLRRDLQGITLISILCAAFVVVMSIVAT